MGVPKFYRWISERYPNISRVINDNQMPDFDNFYLDMNGIIHTCSHINEDNCEINVTEEEIFRNIFHYIDFLFRMIKPKKVFYMAVDGVAPRAKMNQQRSRRFRAGQDRLRKLKAIAEKSGQTLEQVASKHFDTNSITPGTQFMANLDEQLKYFIHVKLTTDPLWDGVDVHLSGHLTPGEGEHKIIDFIRYTRSQPGYNVNTRHCLYGLDADLIMLGLVTHEMHFALLREEVKYGSKKVSKILTPEEITWHLLHTCLFRDYIDLEFRSLKNQLKFPYNLDSIIDDWILMAYLVGNDFIPHLPHIHINEEALSILWDTYKKVLPTLDGYMNESGELNLQRFDVYLTELAKLDHQRYANENDTFRNLDKLTGRNKYSSKKKPDIDRNDSTGGGFDLSLLDKLPTESSIIESQQESNKKNVERVISNEFKPVETVSSSDDDDLLSDSDAISEKSNDEENKLPSTQSKVFNEDDLDSMPLIEAEFRQHKNNYYREKMKIDLTSIDQLAIHVEEYIEALQWILKYYYQGCPSWAWYYPHHYAPYLSDLKNFKHLNISFETSTPFNPFEQLLSVLPPTSRQLLPTPLQSLMVDPNSPLLHFYPENFQLDINEKKQDWEAIVLLPFIDEKLLLDSITKCYNQLNADEQRRNRHSPSTCFTTSATLHPIGNALKTNPCFPSITETRATSREIPVDYYRPLDFQARHSRFEDKDMVLFPRYPVLNVLPYKYGYKSSAVDLFESRSKGTTLVLSLAHRPDSDCITYNQEWNPKDAQSSIPFQITNKKLLVERYLGKRVFVNWPHFQYGIVAAISDFQHLYTWHDIPGGAAFYVDPVDTEQTQNQRNYVQTPIYVSQYPFEVLSDHNKKALISTHPLNEAQTQLEYTKALSINRNYENRQGVAIGPIPVLLYVCPLIGYRTRCSSKSDRCRTAMCFSNQALAYPLQTALFELPNYKDDVTPMPQTLSDYLKVNDPIFSLQSPYYASSGHVQKIQRDHNGKYTAVCRFESSDSINHPDIHNLAPKLSGYQLKYYTAYEIANRLKTSSCVISKITGKINVFGQNKRTRRAIPSNIGFSWKVNRPVKQLFGYTKKIDQIWYYSETAIAVISEYMSKFGEIIAELERRPNDDNYFESNIWPDKKGKTEVQQVRAWIKSLPTYSIPLTDSAWNILDAPVVNEIENIVKKFYIKRAAKTPTNRMKDVSLEPDRIFKASETLGVCVPDVYTEFYLYDRVVNVRLGTGVPIGSLGTIIGIMLGRSSLDTYYEVLFDSLPSNSLDSILLGKNQQKCRIKVRPYHLLNYSHSLRIRSMSYDRQQSVPAHNAWDQRSSHRTSNSRPQQHPKSPRDSKSNSHGHNTVTEPKSAPPLTNNAPPMFSAVQQHNSTTNDLPLPTGKPVQSVISTENSASFVPMTDNMPHLKTFTSSAPSNASSNALFFRAIQDYQQPQNPLQQLSQTDPSIPLQSSASSMFGQQVWQATTSQDYTNPLTNQSLENMPQPTFYPFQNQQLVYFSPEIQQTPTSSLYSPATTTFNQTYPGQLIIDRMTDESFFPPYDLPPSNESAAHLTEPGITSIPSNYEQSQNTPQQSPPIPSSPKTPSRPLNVDALQFVPSQVLRNIPKK